MILVKCGCVAIDFLMSMHYMERKLSPFGMWENTSGQGGEKDVLNIQAGLNKLIF